MKKMPPIPPATLRKQAAASDPRNSVWVSANAGSGKTHVLAQRVTRLLLGGTDPSRILCLTYTRAAAANMSNRVFETLSAWTMLPDDELAERIAELEGDALENRPPRSSRMPAPDAADGGQLVLFEGERAEDEQASAAKARRGARTGDRDEADPAETRAERLVRARKLFTKALETPGGLKVQTIHAFCESVLHQFAIEANVAAHFDMLDPRMEEALFAEARRDMISGAAGGGSAELAEAFATVLERGGEFGLDTLLAEIVTKRDDLRRFIDAARFGSQKGRARSSHCSRNSGSLPMKPRHRWRKRHGRCPGSSQPTFPSSRAAAAATGATRLLKDVLPQASLGFAEPDPVIRLRLLAEGFLKADGDAYKPSALLTKSLTARLPDAADRYSATAARIIAVTDRLAQFRMIEGTHAALIVADWLIGRYEQLKAGRGFLDFNDLITRTARLLARQDAGPWVQYKLDQRHRSRPAGRGAGHQPRAVECRQAPHGGVFRRSRRA